MGNKHIVIQHENGDIAVVPEEHASRIERAITLGKDAEVEEYLKSLPREEDLE